MSEVNWKKIVSEESLDILVNKSFSAPQIIFKYSSRCSLSDTMLYRFEHAWDENEMQGVTPFFLDIIRFRAISNQIEDRFDVLHESPQLLVIKEGQCVFHSSHTRISYEEIKAFWLVKA